MPLCRVYLLTYRRQHLLPRALKSLLDQTFTDWICELHNDDPSDPIPGQLVEQIADPRVVVVNHSQNLGPTATFNLVFQSVPEPFICLLEDDNWWEPHFLATMTHAMKQFPTVQVAWANMRFWQEEADGTWTDLGRNIWDVPETDSPILFNWGQKQQIMGALHSNGTLIVRSQSAERYVIPNETSSAAMELVRERTFPFPILFIPQVCANFAVTQTTSRSNNRVIWAQMQTFMIASFFKHTPMEAESIKQFWSEIRTRTARSTNGLFFAALLCSECRNLLRYAELSDWLFFIASSIKRPFLMLQVLRSIKTYPKLWDFLDRHTANRVEEARRNADIAQQEKMQVFAELKDS